MQHAAKLLLQPRKQQQQHGRVWSGIHEIFYSRVPPVGILQQ
jgi:hypothetical protein